MKALTPHTSVCAAVHPRYAMRHAQAVADGVNVSGISLSPHQRGEGRVRGEQFRIKTEVSELGSKVEAGYWLQVLDKPTRARRLTLATTQLDDDFEYAPEQLDPGVQTPDQIRMLIRTVDCVGVCERDMTDSRPMDQQKSVPLEKRLQAVALGNTQSGLLANAEIEFGRPRPRSNRKCIPTKTNNGSRAVQEFEGQSPGQAAATPGAGA